MIEKIMLAGIFGFLLVHLVVSFTEEPEDVTYEEVLKLGVNCSRLDSCNVQDHDDDLSQNNCHCGSFCSQFDSCCADSPYRLKNDGPNVSRIKCRRVSRLRSVFMIDSCHPSWDNESLIAQLCLADAKSQNDLMLMIPVTSVQSNITYRNYFCFVCNDENQNQMPTFWRIQILGFSDYSQPIPKLSYDYNQTAWVLEDEQNGGIYPVTLTLMIPFYAQSHICRGELVSECAPKWKDEDTRKKCSSYMGILSSKQNGTNILYRNVHCAICNFDDLQNIECEPEVVYIAYGFAFTQLLDVNFSDGDKVGTVQKCAEHLIYDPFFKKCRVSKCVLPGYSVRNGKCVKT